MGRVLLVVLMAAMFASSLPMPRASVPPPSAVGEPDGDWWAEDIACKVCGREWESGEAHAVCIVVYHGLQSDEETAVAVARPDFFVEPPPVDGLHAVLLTEIPRPPPTVHVQTRTPFKVPIS